MKSSQYLKPNTPKNIKDEIYKMAVRTIKLKYSKRTEGYILVSGYRDFEKDMNDDNKDGYIRYLACIGYKILKKEIERRDEIVNRMLF